MSKISIKHKHSIKTPFKKDDETMIEYFNRIRKGEEYHSPDEEKYTFDMDIKYKKKDDESMNDYLKRLEKINLDLDLNKFNLMLEFIKCTTKNNSLERLGQIKNLHIDKFIVNPLDFIIAFNKNIPLIIQYKLLSVEEIIRYNKTPSIISQSKILSLIKIMLKNTNYELINKDSFITIRKISFFNTTVDISDFI
jgi:hypothetical protein